MADQPPPTQQHAPGGHYSGHNPVPTVRKFIENLDKDKADRDRRIDQQGKANGTTDPNAVPSSLTTSNGEAVPHRPQKAGIEGTQKTVTDPTTGRQVVIEDVGKSMLSQVENPTLSVPNANLDKETVGLFHLLHHLLGSYFDS